jgi:DNA-directed DNA polymerase III PolC
MNNFSHLQVHSHYTMLGATGGVTELAERAAADSLTHLALTDTNALYGVVAFSRACRKVGVQPILGMTVSVAAPEEEIATDAARNYRVPGRLVLLATGPDGYRSLCRLSSLVQGCPEREATAARGLNWEALKRHRKGLICLSGGRMSWVERYIRIGDLSAARRYAGHLAGIYGESAYLSLELHRPHDQDVAREVIGLGQRLGLPSLAVQPVYCMWPQDAPRLQLLAAIDRNCSLDKVPSSALPADGDPAADLHWLSPDEVALRFASFPQAVTAVGEMTVRCRPSLPDGRSIWPALSLPEGQTEHGALSEWAHTGLLERFGPTPPPEVGKRLERELTTISRHGYAPLFLVVADIMRYARKVNLPSGTRGSVANSLVAYCVGISTVDPITNDLLFERFLSPDRADLPDIDLNFCSRRRDEVLSYVRRTYGPDRVALVATISSMGPRSAIRETAKVYGLDETEIDPLIAALPRGWLSTWRRDRTLTVENVLAELTNVRWRQIVRAADNLVGQPHHLSLHPGGIVITPGQMTDVVPVQWTPKGYLTTQFDQRDLKAIGLPKIDLLGIRALTVLAATADLVRRHYDVTFLTEEIPPDDPQTSDQLTRADTIGVFQCESAGARRTMRQLKTRSVFDLAVANAFFKPAPAMGGMADTFVRRYRDEEPVPPLHPALEPILGRTKGVILFQEQVLRVAREIAGLSWSEADGMRRGVKLEAEESAQLHQRFLAGCQAQPPDGPGLAPGQARTLWEQLTAFAGFSLNQGHATAYADTSYRSAYAKAHWPAAFLCARLANRGGFHHPAIYIAEAVRLGMVVRPPHVNHSARAFTLEVTEAAKDRRPKLWMGLGQVRELRRASIQAIVTQREQCPYSDLRDLLRRTSLQTKEIRHLVQCGALDELGKSRAALLAEAEEIERAGSANQLAFTFTGPLNSPETAGQRAAWEQWVLGQPVSVHPLELVADLLPTHTPLRELQERSTRRITIAGVRLPGWTGGHGFFLGDGDTFIVVRGSDRAPPPWQPAVLRGHWLSDEWGTFWFQADAIEAVEP